MSRVSTAQAIANPLGRIFGLKVARRRKRCEGVAGAPERLGRLTGAKLAAVPHDGRARAARRGFGRETHDVLTALLGKRAPGIDIGSDRIAVVNEIRSRDQPTQRRLSTCSVSSGVRFFAGGNAHLQTILRQRNGAGRIGIERAGRIVGLVEIQHRRPVVPQVRVQEARGLVGFLAARAVAEDVPEPLRPASSSAAAARSAR